MAARGKEESINLARLREMGNSLSLQEFMEKIGEVEYTLETYPYMPHVRGDRWLYAMCGIAAVLLLYAIFTGAWLMLVAVGLFCFVYYLEYTKPQAEHLSLVLGSTGMAFQGKVYAYAELESFNFMYYDTFVSLDVITKKQVRKKIYLLDPAQVPLLRKRLAPKLKELHDEKEDLVHRLIRLLKL